MKKFIDFDKIHNVFYDNLWIEEHKLAIKTPLEKKDKYNPELIVEKFDLSKFSYLLSYE